MDLMSEASMGRLNQLVLQELQEFKSRASDTVTYDLFKEMQKVLTSAACEWVGVDVEAQDLESRTEDFTALFDSAANTLPGHLHSRLARKRCEAWLSKEIKAFRKAPAKPAVSPFEHLATARDLNGKYLPARVAAVEVLNLLRPIVAVSVYIVFCAHALYMHPNAKAEILLDEAGLDDFVQEVRRFYPFFPAVIAKVKEDFEWRGFHFKKGTQTILDLFGTNHDERSWQSPQLFMPSRFRDRRENAFDLIPQGGGDHAKNHRCPGEWITIGIMKTATRFLIQDLNYDVPPQDLNLNWQRKPALPKSRFQIRIG